jgi:hypothetical protein
MDSCKLPLEMILDVSKSCQDEDTRIKLALTNRTMYELTHREIIIQNVRQNHFSQFDICRRGCRDSLCDVHRAYNCRLQCDDPTCDVHDRPKDFCGKCIYGEDHICQKQPAYLCQVGCSPVRECYEHKRPMWHLCKCQLCCAVSEGDADTLAIILSDEQLSSELANRIHPQYTYKATQSPRMAREARSEEWVDFLSAAKAYLHVHTLKMMLEWMDRWDLRHARSPRLWSTSRLVSSSSGYEGDRTLLNWLITRKALVWDRMDEYTSDGVEFTMDIIVNRGRAKTEQDDGLSGWSNWDEPMDYFD